MVAAIPLIMAGTSAIGAGISLVDMLTRDSEFENVGPTGAQRQLLGLQTQNIQRLQSQTGMSAADVQKVQQVQQGQREQNVQNINALQQSNLSFFDRQRIGEALQREIQRTQKRSEDVLSLLDVGQESERISAASRATAAAAAQAEQIRAAETQKAMLQEQERQQRVKSLQSIFGSLGKTAALGFAGFSADEADQEAQSSVAGMSPNTSTTENMALGQGQFRSPYEVGAGGSLFNEAQSRSVNSFSALSLTEGERLRRNEDILGTDLFENVLGFYETAGFGL